MCAAQEVAFTEQAAAPEQSAAHTPAWAHTPASALAADTSSFVTFPTTVRGTPMLPFAGLGGVSPAQMLRTSAVAHVFADSTPAVSAVWKWSSQLRVCDTTAFVHNERTTEPVHLSLNETGAARLNTPPCVPAGCLRLSCYLRRAGPQQQPRPQSRCQTSPPANHLRSCRHPQSCWPRPATQQQLHSPRKHPASFTPAHRPPPQPRSRRACSTCPRPTPSVAHLQWHSRAQRPQALTALARCAPDLLRTYALLPLRYWAVRTSLT